MGRATRVTLELFVGGHLRRGGGNWRREGVAPGQACTMTYQGSRAAFGRCRLHVVSTSKTMQAASTFAFILHDAEKLRIRGAHGVDFFFFFCLVPFWERLHWKQG